MDFEIRLLRCALTLAEHRNFARAAAELRLSQPSLTRSIQSLEQQAGVQIFERSSRRVEVTDAGVIFLEHAREVMAHSSDLSREMELLRGLVKGELQIGVGTYMSDLFTDRALARIVRQHPNVTLRIAGDNWANLVPLLRRRELDLAVVAVGGIGDDDELHITPLSLRQGYLAVRPGHPLLSRKAPITMRDVLLYPFASTSRFPADVLRQVVGEAVLSEKHAQGGPKSVPSIACESVSMMKTIAQGSDAVALVPLTPLLADLEAGIIAILPLELSLLKPAFGIVRLARRSLSPLGELFVRTLLEVDAEVAALEEKAAERLFPVARRRSRKRAADLRMS